METRNVSAQLYYKQLPKDNAASLYNCENTFPNLSTCVNNVETDKQLENAYQQQLNLSEMYKSPEIFKKMKEEFTEQTMEAENTPTKMVTSSVYPKPPSVPIQIPVGPTDFLNKFIKESFGSTSGGIPVWVYILIVAIIIGVAAFFYMKKQS